MERGGGEWAVCQNLCSKSDTLNISHHQRERRAWLSPTECNSCRYETLSSIGQKPLHAKAHITKTAGSSITGLSLMHLQPESTLAAAAPEQGASCSSQQQAPAPDTRTGHATQRASGEEEPRPRSRSCEGPGSVGRTLATLQGSSNIRVEC